MNVRFLPIKLLPVVSVLLLILSLFSISCRKEYVDKFNIVPGDTVKVSGYNHITSFIVHEFSADTALTATITNDSIIVYWPLYKKAPATIKPEILLPGKTTILPATGTEVPFVKGTKFTVTAESGEKKIYSLGIDYSQPKPWFGLIPFSLTVGDPISFDGDWFLRDISRTKVILVSVGTKKEYETEVVGFAKSPTFIIPRDIPLEGFYDVKIINGKHTVYNSNADGIGKMTLAANLGKKIHVLGSPFTVKEGETFTIRGYNIGSTSAASMGVGATRNPMPLEIVEAKFDRVTFRVPIGTPDVLYRGLRLTLSDDEFQPYNSGIYITVTK